MGEKTEVAQPDLAHLTDKEFFRRQRPARLLRGLPDLLSYGSVLCVGARTYRMDFGEDFRNAGYRIDVIEIWLPNVEHLKGISWIQRVIHGDVRDATSIVKELYDVVFWWHGPEHIPKRYLEKTLEGLRDIATKLVVCASPWGVHEQGPLYDNPWEIHRSTLYPEDFQRIGFNTSTLGIKDVPGSNILISWYRKSATK